MPRRFSLQNASGKHIFIVVGAVLVLYNEYFSFFLSACMWPHLSASRNPNEKELRILFVADPQLIGLRDEPPLIGIITRWDADRYLQSGFYQAVGHVRPDVVVFLGDLLDEGSSGSDEEFISYVHRFFKVFKTPAHVKLAFVSGDNDVGGEAADVKLSWKVDRFKKYFNKTMSNYEFDDFFKMKFADFFMISLDYGEAILPSAVQRWSYLAKDLSTSQFRFVFNHMTLLNRRRSTISEVIGIIKPHAIFTAHTHSAQLYQCNDCRVASTLENLRQPLPDWNGAVSDLTYSGPIDLELADMSRLYEIVIPTCSYRMGVPNMGYGYSVVRGDGKMSFAVLWLPGRYRQLACYVLFIAVTLIVLTVRAFCALCSRASAHYAQSKGGSRFH